LSSKIQALVDALGNLVGFFLTGGEAHDLVGADERVVNPLIAAGKTVVIPPRAHRQVSRDYDRDLFKARHLIENFFARLKQFRAIATRYDKTARNFLADVRLAAITIWLN
jgi:transposase